MINFMESLLKDLNSKKSKTLLFYVLYIAIISILLFIGLSGNIHADTVNNQQNANQQFKHQNQTVLIKKTNQQVNHNHQGKITGSGMV
ncbi:MAG: Hypothetical protein AJITA_00618 [Acetilactobacillus jinshanensis]